MQYDECVVIQNMLNIRIGRLMRSDAVFKNDMLESLKLVIFLRHRKFARCLLLVFLCNLIWEI